MRRTRTTQNNSPRKRRRRYHDSSTDSPSSRNPTLWFRRGAQTCIIVQALKEDQSYEKYGTPRPPAERPVQQNPTNLMRILLPDFFVPGTPSIRVRKPPSAVFLCARVKMLFEMLAVPSLRFYPTGSPPRRPRLRRSSPKRFRTRHAGA